MCTAGLWKGRVQAYCGGRGEGACTWLLAPAYSRSQGWTCRPGQRERILALGLFCCRARTQVLGVLSLLAAGAQGSGPLGTGTPIITPWPLQASSPQHLGQHLPASLAQAGEAVGAKSARLRFPTQFRTSLNYSRFCLVGLRAWLALPQSLPKAPHLPAPLSSPTFLSSPLPHLSTLDLTKSR